jgi:hypothetical protein
MACAIAFAGFFVGPPAVADPTTESAYPFVAREKIPEYGEEQLRRIRDSWLDCYECQQGEFERVVSAGPAIVPLLREVATDGGVPESFETSLTETLKRAREHAESRGMGFAVDIEGYVASQRREYVRLRQARARRALDAIDTSTGPPTD